jgi:hypothetical protein
VHIREGRKRSSDDVHRNPPQKGSTVKLRPIASRQIKGGALAFLAVALLSAGSPLVATSAASNAGGADKPVSTTHGDCKNMNDGVHNGSDCPAPVSVN